MFKDFKNEKKNIEKHLCLKKYSICLIFNDILRSQLYQRF